MTDSENNRKCRSALRSSAVSLRALRPVQRRSVEVELSARFAHEVQPLRDILYRNAFRISRNHADAEDLMQETTMKAYAGFHTFRPDTNMQARLLRILIKSYISDYRKKRRQPGRYSTEELAEQRLAQTYTRSAPAELRSAEDQALDSLPHNDIKSAMQALPQRFRGVAYYLDVEGLRYREIAAIANASTGTVASQLHRGRRQLRMPLGGGARGAGTQAMSATA